MRPEYEDKDTLSPRLLSDDRFVNSELHLICLGIGARLSTQEEQLDPSTDISAQLRLFDPQLCEQLDLNWLKGVVEAYGVTGAEVDRLADDGILRRWKSPSGFEGFLIYSERQVLVAKSLRDSGRYSTAELRHCFEDWNVQIELCQTDIWPMTALRSRTMSIFAVVLEPTHNSS